jgi:hypothetical protein
MDVARDSRLIALATGRDSMAMKTVALLTMFFLPATFLAVRSNSQRRAKISCSLPTVDIIRYANL